MANNRQSKKNFKTLLSTLANGSTGNARELLKHHTGSDAQNSLELQNKLEELWANSDNKPLLEKQFALIHPHKDFILKYAMPKQPEVKVIQAGNNQTENEDQAACDGSPACNCPQTEKLSGVDGTAPQTIVQGESNTFAILALVSIVGIIGLLISKNK